MPDATGFQVASPTLRYDAGSGTRRVGAEGSFQYSLFPQPREQRLYVTSLYRLHADQARRDQEIARLLRKGKKQ